MGRIGPEYIRLTSLNTGFTIMPNLRNGVNEGGANQTDSTHIMLKLGPQVVSGAGNIDHSEREHRIYKLEESGGVEMASVYSICNLISF